MPSFGGSTSVICRLFYRFFWRSKVSLTLIRLNLFSNQRMMVFLFLNKLDYFISKCNEKLPRHVMQPFISFKNQKKKNSYFKISLTYCALNLINF